MIETLPDERHDAALAADASSPRIVPASLPIRFVGSGSEYFRIWIVNLLLTLVTLGLYYPWAKVRRMRYFHAATEVGGHPLSYHAQPAKMLRGYLLVALMLAAYSAAGHFSATAGAVALVIVGALWPALWHSSLRFRLANTGWRGLRLRHTATRRQAYQAMAVPVAVMVLWFAATALLAPEPPPRGEAPAPRPPEGLWAAWLPLLVLLPALAVMPWAHWRLKRLQHAHFAWAGEISRFGVGLRDFYALALRTTGVGIGVVLLTGVLAAALGIVAGIAGVAGAGTGPWNPMIPLVGMVVVYLVVMAAVGGYGTARLQNVVWNGSRTAHLRFESRLRARALAGLWLKNTLLVVCTLGLYFPFAQVNSARLRLQSVSLIAEVDLDALQGSGAGIDESAAGDAAGDLFGIDVGP